jgi:asparagine synthase (glutamine-hydrolysing)
MCGIYGEVSLSDRYKPDPATVRTMGAAIIHRGPDDDDMLSQNDIAMGLRRLSIIDVGGGRQPIYNEDQSIAVVCNGELYNFRELRTALQKQGHTFRTGSDVEVLVHLYEQHGDNLVRHILGMFAFALWDGRRHRLLLGRDRLGIKPLYYARRADRLVFASESKAIIGRPDFPPQLDTGALQEFLALGYVPQPYTMFAGIRKLPPAHLAVIENGTCTEKPYWSLAIAPRTEFTENDWISEIDRTLELCVKSQMVSDVPIGAFLSGGVDSSTIVAYMSRVSDAPVQTYSIGYAGSSGAEFYNELDYARQVAHAFHTDHHEILVEPRMVSMLPELIWHMDEPTADTALITSSLVAQFASQHVKVILSGVGGDELFGGYDRYLMSHYVGMLRRVPQSIRSSILAPLLRSLPVARHSRALNLFRYARRVALLAEQPAGDRYHGLMEVFRSADLAALLHGTLSAQPDALQRALQQFPDETELDRMFAADLATQLTDDLLLLTDKTSMAHSLECRVPLLDERLVDLAASIPASLRVRGSQTRYILKKALRTTLPEVVLKRKKRGFGAPLGAWLQNELLPVLDRLLSPDVVRRRGLFRPAAVASVIAEHRAKRADHTDHLFALMTLELWMRLFIDGERPADVSTSLTG